MSGEGRIQARRANLADVVRRRDVDLRRVGAHALGEHARRVDVAGVDAHGERHPRRRQGRARLSGVERLQGDVPNCHSATAMRAVASRATVISAVSPGASVMVAGLTETVAPAGAVASRVPRRRRRRRALDLAGPGAARPAVVVGEARQVQRLRVAARERVGVRVVAVGLVEDEPGSAGAAQLDPAAAHVERVGGRRAVLLEDAVSLGAVAGKRRERCGHQRRTDLVRRPGRMQRADRVAAARRRAGSTSRCR